MHKKYYLVTVLSIFLLALFSNKALAFIIHSNFESSSGKNTFTEEYEMQIANNPPEFGRFNLPIAISGQEYIGYIDAYDIDGDPLKWKIELLDADQNIATNYWNSWQPQCRMSSNQLSLDSIHTQSRFINKIQSCKVGSPNHDGSERKYYFRVTVRDNRGGAAIATSSIRVHSLPSLSVPNNFVYVASSSTGLSFSATSSGGSYPHSLLIDGFPPGWEKKLTSLPGVFNISASFDPAGNSYFKYPNATTTHSLDLVSVNALGVKSNKKNIKITVVNNPPSISLLGGVGIDCCPDSDGICHATTTGSCCTDTCQSKGYECGEETICGFRVNCGVCSYGVCSSNNKCECVPNCSGRSCDSDGCGETCTPGCTAPDVCNYRTGKCVDTSSAPEPTPVLAIPATPPVAADPGTPSCAFDGATKFNCAIRNRD